MGGGWVAIKSAPRQLCATRSAPREHPFLRVILSLMCPTWLIIRSLLEKREKRKWKKQEKEKEKSGNISWNQLAHTVKEQTRLFYLCLTVTHSGFSLIVYQYFFLISTRTRRSDRIVFRVVKQTSYMKGEEKSFDPKLVTRKLIFGFPFFFLRLSLFLRLLCKNNDKMTNGMVNNKRRYPLRWNR